MSETVVKINPEVGVPELELVAKLLKSPHVRRLQRIDVQFLVNCSCAQKKYWGDGAKQWLAKIESRLKLYDEIYGDEK